MKVQLAVLSLAALAFAGTALSQQKESGIYVGGALGQAEQSDQCSSPAAGVSCDNKDSAWKIFGGFQFNRHLAAEVGYANLGEASASVGTVSARDEATAIELVALGMFPVVERFSIFGKLGLVPRRARAHREQSPGRDRNELADRLHVRPRRALRRHAQHRRTRRVAALHRSRRDHRCRLDQPRRAVQVLTGRRPKSAGKALVVVSRR